MISLFFNITLCDAPMSGEIGIQAPATPMLIGMISFHYYLMIFIVAIAITVFYVLGYILYSYNSNVYSYNNIMKFSHSNDLEIIWTVIPAILLIFLAIPSFNLLYSLDEAIDPVYTLKVIGHQWYWSYEYSDQAFTKKQAVLNYDSYMAPFEDFKKCGYKYRLLEVDNRVYLPIRRHIRILVTSADVLHSWAIPSFGIKIDACPGRLSQASLYIKRFGIYYGQCSEICGVNHGFMPIVILADGKKRIIKWLAYALAKDNLIYHP
jgi:cytochrome c oxidase subunit 2